MMISKNFSLRELCRSQMATRHGIENTPDAKQFAALKALANNVLEPIRAFYGLPYSPSSCFRCLSLNRLLGSSDTSQHPKGEASDIELPGVDNMELATWMSGNLVFDQLILEYYEEGEPASGWVHVSYKADANRGEILSKDAAGYRSGLHAVRTNHVNEGDKS